MTYQQGFALPPRDEYRDSLANNANDREFRQRLYDAAPNLNLLGLRFGGSSLSDDDRLKAAQLGIDTGAITDLDLFSFGKWKALDAIKPKERAAQLEIPMAKAAEDRQFKLQQYQLDRQQDLQRDQAQMNFDFDSQRAEKQSKLNLRQAMINSTLQRTNSPINWFN